MNIGRRIKEVFEKSGMTIAELARQANTSRTNIYNIFEKDDLLYGQVKLFSQILHHDFIKELAGIEEDDRVANERRQTEDYRMKASAYLALKKRVGHYAVTFMTEGGEVKWRIPFDLYFAKVLQQAILDGKDPAELEDWDAVTMNPEWHYGKILKVVDVDFTPIYFYRFSVAYTQKSTTIAQNTWFEAQLKDEDYVKLLTYLMKDRSLTANRLLRKDKDLYDKINFWIPGWINGLGCAWMFFFDEAQEDVVEILGEPELSEEVFIAEKPDGYLYHTMLHIHDGVMHFWAEAFCETGLDLELDEHIDLPLRVAKTILGEPDNAGILKHLQSSFSGFDGIQRLQKLVDGCSHPLPL